MTAPDNIQSVGDMIAIHWADSSESYYPMDVLRAASPSAETAGERDLFGKLIGGNPGQEYPGVTVTGWEGVGGYAVLFKFSDGHATGIYTFDYLRKLGIALSENGLV